MPPSAKGQINSRNMGSQTFHNIELAEGNEASVSGQISHLLVPHPDPLDLKIFQWETQQPFATTSNLIPDFTCGYKAAAFSSDAHRELARGFSPQRMSYCHFSHAR